MRKGNVKILLLMLFILAGLAFIFMLTLKSGSQAEKAAQAQAEEKIDDSLLAQMPENKTSPEKKDEYLKKLDEFKKMAATIEQKDMAKFKMQTNEAFMALAELLTGFCFCDNCTKADCPCPCKSEELIENVDEMKMIAKNIPTIELQDEMVMELKKGFKAAEEALQELVEENLSDAKEEKQEQKFEPKLEQLETKINEIDQKNYKAKTKDLFLSIESILKQKVKEMPKAKK